MHFILETKLSSVKYSLSSYTHNHTVQYLIQTQKHTKTNGENKEEKVGKKREVTYGYVIYRLVDPHHRPIN